jgi:hypothetical protein
MTKGSSFLGILLLCAYGEPVQASIPATLKPVLESRLVSGQNNAPVTRIMTRNR